MAGSQGSRDDHNNTDHLLYASASRRVSISARTWMAGRLDFDPFSPSNWDIEQAIETMDYPASYHDRAGSLSFADGHAEIRRWKDSRTMPPL